MVDLLEGSICQGIIVRCSQKLVLFFSILMANVSWGQPAVYGESAVPVVVVQRGDKVVLAAKSETELSSATEVRWHRYGRIICRKLRCVLNTANLGLGEHKIGLILKNGSGTKSLAVRLKVLASPPGYRPTTVEPDLQLAGGGVVTLKNTDLYVEAVSGRGFAKLGGQMRVVSNAAEPLKGVASLSTLDSGYLRFGRAGVEEHVMPPGSRIDFLSNEGKHRILVLKQGALRTRTLGTEAPAWSIVVGSRLQIDPGLHSDLLIGISPKSESVLLTALRGQARVVREVVEDKKGGPPKHEVFTIPQGVSMRLALGVAGEVVFEPPPLESLQEVFARTSPQYVPDYKTGWRGEMVAASSASLAEMIKNRDYIAALQEIMRTSKNSFSPSSLRMLATCYAGIFQYRVAKIFLAKALAGPSPNKVELLELQGSIALAEKKWGTAGDSFEKAIDIAPQQRLYYYRGVSQFYLKKKYAAEQAFLYALWDAPDEELRLSSQKFLTAIDEETWLRLALSTGVRFDSNVTRAQASDAPDKVAQRSGKGYAVDLDLRAQVLAQRLLSFDLLLHGHYAGWSGTDLLAYNVTNIGLRLPLSAFVPGKKAAKTGRSEDSIFGFGITPLITTETLGGNRLADAIGADLWIGSPFWFGAKAVLESRIITDATPTEVDLLGPVLREPVTTSDRSAKMTAYGIAVSPIKDKYWSADLKLLTGRTYYRYAAAQVDGHEALALNASLRYAPSPRYYIEAGIDSETRSFPDLVHSKDDQLFGMRLKWLVHFTPSLWIAVDGASWSHNSGRESATFTRQTLGLTTGLFL